MSAQHFYDLLWVKQCHKPPTTGNSKFSINMIMTGKWCVFMAFFYHFTPQKTINFQPSDHSTLHSPGTTWPSPRSPPAAPPPGLQPRRNGGPTGHTGPRRPRRCRRQKLGPTGRAAPPGYSSNVLRKDGNDGKEWYGYGSIPILIPFLGGWTSIYQLFWCELQGYKVLTHCHMFFFSNNKSTK